MEQSKVCKGSIRYDSPDPDAAITNVYVKKAALGNPAPANITVTADI